MTEASQSDLAQWAAAAAGCEVMLELIPGGGSRVSYVVHAAAGPRYLLRVDSGTGPLSGTEFTIEREFHVISALHRASFPVPGIIAYSAPHNAMLMEFVEGSTSYQVRVSPEKQRDIQADLMRQVVCLHSLSPRELGLTDFARTATIEAAVRHDVERLTAMYSPAAIRKEPEIDFALSWLRRNIPDAERPARLVHGDVGPGNFIFGPDGRVRAIIDWEVVHMGHPLEDLAAVLCRSLGVSFGSCAEHIANYATFARAPVERDALAFGVILVLTRWYIGLNLAVSRPSTSQNVPVLLTYRQSVADALVQALAERYGLPELPALQLPAAADTDFVHEYILETLGEVVVPALENAYARDRAQGLTKLSLYLRDRALYGAERLEREEIEDVATLSGVRYPGYAAARAAACEQARVAGDSEAPRLIQFLQSVNRRRHLIWGNAMGEMATRRLKY